jgi:hypothetical protein
MRGTIKKIGLLLLVSTVVGGLFYTYLAYSATGSLPARWYASSLYGWSWLAAVLTGAGLYAYGAVVAPRLDWQGNVGTAAAGELCGATPWWRCSCRPSAW